MGFEEDLRSWSEGFWTPANTQAHADIKALDVGTTLEDRVQRLEDDLEIKAVLRRYHNTYDAHDIEGALDCFTDDAVQINGRGTFIGRDSLRASYDYLVGGQKMIMHYATGLYVTYESDERDTALLTCRLLAYFVPWEGEPSMHGGTYVNRMKKVDGRWLIAEQRITFNFQFDITLSPRELGTDLPEPDFPLSQFDLVDPRYLYA